VIPPAKGPAFVAALPVKRFHGVGPKTAEKMVRLGIETGADLRTRPREWLLAHFGSWGAYLYDAARGLDDRPVRPDRIRKSLGAENTFSTDLRSPTELLEALDGIVDTVWPRIEAAQARGRTVTLKVKYDDFRQITRARSFAEPVSDRARFAEAGRSLMLALCPVDRPVRLLGLTLSALDQAGDDAKGVQLGLGL
jgi:DNA polymerase IV